MSGDEGRKRSFSELDRMKKEGPDRQTRTPKSERAQEISKTGTEQYLRSAAKHLFGGSADEEGERLTKEIRNAHGTKALPEACRAYLEARGIPKEVSLLGIFLDSHDGALIEAALEELASGEYELGSGSMRPQLRVLAYHQNDAIAELAEELLEGI